MPEDKAKDISWNKRISIVLKNAEKHLKFNNIPAPEAYLIVSNNPDHYHLEDFEYISHLMVTGFKIPDFGYVISEKSTAIVGKHLPIFQLVDSIVKHRKIPNDFPDSK